MPSDDEDVTGTSAARRPEARRESASNTLRTILGEYVVGRHTSVPRASLVSAMQTCGVGADATRQALSRAVRGGAVHRSAAGSSGELQLSLAGGKALESVSSMTNDWAQPVWDQTWSLIIVRGSGSAASPHGVRSTLLTEGLGRLGSGVWITPHSARSDRTTRMLREDPALDLYTCRASFDQPASQIVAQAFDLEVIRQSYESAISVLEDLMSPDGPDGPDELVRWTSAARAWLYLMHSDPGLPEEAIGGEWPLAKARELMQICMARWRAAAVDQFDASVTKQRQ